MDLERFQRAIELRDSGKVEEALRELTAVVESTPDPGERASVLLNVSGCHQLLGDLEKARQSWREARDIQPRDQWAAYVDVQEADILISEGNHEAALGKLNKIWVVHGELLRRTEHVDLYKRVQVERGILEAQLGHLDEAEPILDEVVSFELDDAVKGDVAYSLGLCRFAAGALDDARKQFLTAIEKRAQEVYLVRAHYYLGIVYCRQGAHAWGLRELERAEVEADKGGLSKDKLYKWLSIACRFLGQGSRADRYEELAHSS